MSLEKALGYLEKAGYREHVIQLGESTATVAMAAEALGVEPGRIAKTMSFLQGDKAVLIITEGTAKIDNRKYKDTFHVKAKMIPFEEVENIIGHAPGGVCPFGINAGIDVYLDESLKQFNIVYPAAGNDHSAVKLSWKTRHGLRAGLMCARRRKMFNREDNTYNEIREKSLFQWLDEMEKHEDIAVRGGVKLTREYIQHLKDENKRLEEQNKLKNEYLKKVVGR